MQSNRRRDDYRNQGVKASGTKKCQQIFQNQFLEPHLLSHLPLALRSAVLVSWRVVLASRSILLRQCQNARLFMRRVLDHQRLAVLVSRSAVLASRSIHLCQFQNARLMSQRHLFQFLLRRVLIHPIGHPLPFLRYPPLLLLSLLMLLWLSLLLFAFVNKLSFLLYPFLLLFSSFYFLLYPLSWRHLHSHQFIVVEEEEENPGRIGGKQLS